METIPVHKLNERANIGLVLWHSSDDTFKKKGREIGAHRDDHYIFFVIEEGSVVMMIDFTEVTIPAGSICYILPGQVHHGVIGDYPKGWFIAVDTLLIPNEYRMVFEGQLLLQQPCLLSDEQREPCYMMLKLLKEQYHKQKDSAFYLPLVYSLLNSFLGMAACHFVQSDVIQPKVSRPSLIAQQFKRLLSEHIYTIKKPSAYAELLHISESYLNEVLKKVTGFSVTYWILNEAMMEAKRLLYYSDLTVKQIAHQLGYEDHTYFSRLFKKVNQATPLGFRSIYRK